MKSRISKLVLALGASVSLAACATTYDMGADDYGYDDSYGYPDYNGGQYGASGIGGSGARYLDPWLSGTEAGRTLIQRRFDSKYNGRITPSTAKKANAWFRRYADTNRDSMITDREIDQGLQRLAQDYRYY